MAENFFSILKTKCIDRQKIATFRKAEQLIDDFICFYDHERIQLKTRVAPLRLTCDSSYQGPLCTVCTIWGSSLRPTGLSLIYWFLTFCPNS